MSLPSDLESFAMVALAGLLGGVIGFEREIADKPAGLRTHIFVAAGAALLVLLAEGAVDFFRRSGSDTEIAADPIRIIQAIVIGISFLGTGTIIHRGGDEVEGLTTAASIFLTAAIGIAVALDRIWLAVGTTLLALLVLTMVNWIEWKLLDKSPPGNSSD
ncbi:putative Mg(2+) transport ATPase [Maioricimonas rarisocia]|uniref:Putative Mg(2+) transport ATPase n=1 Tax=Maioricimonas rarisocia TaxID=2528026 RepID=A0A517Z4X5_9PLAN|nr:MgtC/SapB family protein [Maioricimonas rarisocia]QDU37497.1 putative Mg(2+) transport ATPase [Maioricimonas rarisocia]